MLADHLDWTESLGMASALQPEDVATAIQMLRAQAEKVGNLKSTAEQVVTSRDEGGENYLPSHRPIRSGSMYHDCSSACSERSTGLLIRAGCLAARDYRLGWNNRRWNQV